MSRSQKIGSSENGGNQFSAGMIVCLECLQTTSHPNPDVSIILGEFTCLVQLAGAIWIKSIQTACKEPGNELMLNKEKSHAHVGNVCAPSTLPCMHWVMKKARPMCGK